MHRNPKNTRNTDNSLGSGMKLLLPSFSLGFSTRGERDTISTMLTVPSDPTTRGHPIVHNWTPPRFESQLLSSIFKSQLTAFFQKSPKILSPFPIRGFIMTSVIITSSPREREHLRSMCAPARALSRIVLSLTKPKDKI